jgi:hypothetical protein
MAASPKLLPHRLPPELLDAIIAHLPDADIFPLLRVNSAWYTVAIPHTFRVHRLTASDLLDLASSKPDRDTPSGRPLFRPAWLQHTHTLEIGEHGADQCTAALQHLKLPALRVLRRPFRRDAHPVQDSVCALLGLAPVLMFTDMDFERVVEPPSPPEGLRVGTIVLQFTTNARQRRRDPFNSDDEGYDFDAHWDDDTGEFDPDLDLFDDEDDFTFPRFTRWFSSPNVIADRAVALLPLPTTEDPDAMLSALQELCTMAMLCPIPLTVVGGFMDVRAPPAMVGYRLAAEHLDHQLQPPDARGLLPLLLRVLASNWANVGDVLEEEREAAVRAATEEGLARVRFLSLDDVLASGELDDVMPREDIRRAVLGQKARL